MVLDTLIQAFDRLLAERRFSDAVALCDETLAGRLTPPLRCRVLQLKAEALLADGAPWKGQAIACLRDARELTRPNSDGRARVLTAMTAAYASTISLQPCLEARNAFCEILHGKRTPTVKRLLPHVEYNLALAYHELDQLEQAQHAYFIALKACGTMSDPFTLGLKAKINHNLIDVFQELGRHDDARTIMDGLFPKLDESMYGAQMHNRRAVSALALGDYASAVLWVECGLGHSSCDPRTRAALTLTKAKIAHATGSIDEAREYADEAVRLAKQAGNNRLLCRALRFAQQVPKGV